MNIKEIEYKYFNELKKPKTYEELYKAYAELLMLYVDAELKKEVLTETIADMLSEKEIDYFASQVQEKIESYVWRNTPKEARDKMAEYGYTKPMVLINKEEALKSFKRGNNVFLLNKNNTEELAKTEEDILNHGLQGGYFGNDQITVDCEMDWVLSDDYEEEY